MSDTSNTVVNSAVGAAVAAGIVELAKLAPELIAIVRRGLAHADTTEPLGPQLEQLLPPVEQTPLGRVVGELRRRHEG